MEAAVVAASAAAAAAKDAALAASVAAAAAAKDAAMAAATAREAMDAVKDAAAAMSAAALHAKEAAVTASAAALNAKDAAAVAATAGEAATVAAAVQASKKRKFHLVDDQDPQGSGNFNDGDFISRLPAKELSVTAPSASLNPKEAAVAALTAALNGKEAAAVAATAGEAAAALQASNKRKFHLIDDENPLGSGNTNDGDFISRLPTVTASSAALNAKEAAMPALAPALNEKEAAAVVSTAVEAAAALQASKKRMIHLVEDEDPPGSGNFDDGDFISRLPVTLLGSIVFLLPTKEAVRTQVISRWWRPLWRSAPLNLVADRELKSKGHKTVDLIPKILSEHPGPACRFSLCLSKIDCYDKIESWLSSQALDKLHELELSNDHWYNFRENLYLLPSSVYRFAPTLCVAKFVGCRFTNLIVMLSLKFPCLKQLTLDRVTISEDALQSMLSGCSALESLELKKSFGFGRLCISSQTVKSIGCCTDWSKIGLFLQELVIEDAPCLERLLPLDQKHGPVAIWVVSAPKLKILGMLSEGISELHFGTTVFQKMIAVGLTTKMQAMRVLVLDSAGPNLDAVVNFLKCFPCLERLYVSMHHQTMDPDLDNFVGTQTCCDPQRVPDSVMLGSHPISSHLVLRLNCRNANAGRDWPILPKDLIDDVAGRLLRYDVAEHLRLRAACKEWRACTADPRTGGDLDSRFRPRNWIMLSSSPKGARRQFINTSTGACALVDLPELSGHRLETYTEGLLLLRDEASDGVRLLNPLTRALTDLPPVTAELGSMHVAWKTPNPSLPRFVYAGISDEPSPATVVLFMQGAMCSIAFAKPGDERWALMDKECWKSLPTRWSGGSDRSKLLDRMPYVSVLTTWGSIYLPTMDGNIVKVSIHPEPRLVPVVANHPFDLLPSNVVSYLVPADDHR
ncbi:hypothetical protein ACQ4PT_022164 [Festuca glaucescens]